MKKKQIKKPIPSIEVNDVVAWSEDDGRYASWNMVGRVIMIDGQESVVRSHPKGHLVTVRTSRLEKVF